MFTSSTHKTWHLACTQANQIVFIVEHGIQCMYLCGENLLSTHPMLSLRTHRQCCHNNSNNRLHSNYMGFAIICSNGEWDKECTFFSMKREAKWAPSVVHSYYKWQTNFTHQAFSKRVSSRRLLVAGGMNWHGLVVPLIRHSLASSAPMFAILIQSRCIKR